MYTAIVKYAEPLERGEKGFMTSNIEEKIYFFQFFTLFILRYGKFWGKISSYKKATKERTG